MTADTPKSEFEKEFEKRYGIGNPEKMLKVRCKNNRVSSLWRIVL